MWLVDFHSLFYSAACSYTHITLSHSQETYLSNENNVLPFSSILVPIPFFSSHCKRCPDPPISLADPGAVKEAVETLKFAKKPLVIIGKGPSIGAAAVIQ